MLTTYISQPEIIYKLTSSQSLPSPPFGTTERLSPGLWSSVRPGIKLKLITHKLHIFPRGDGSSSWGGQGPTQRSPSHSLQLGCLSPGAWDAGLRSRGPSGWGRGVPHQKQTSWMALWLQGHFSLPPPPSISHLLLHPPPQPPSSEVEATCNPGGSGVRGRGPPSQAAPWWEGVEGLRNDRVPGKWA